MGTTRSPLATRTAGVRDAKARLSQLLDEVQQGHEWTITDRGQPIARLVPITKTEAPLASRLRRLERSGVIEPAPRKPSPIPPPLPLAAGYARRIPEEDRNG
jgi:prevent-host-death family protein